MLDKLKHSVYHGHIPCPLDGLQTNSAESCRFALENLASSELVSEIRQMNLAKQNGRRYLVVSLDFCLLFINGKAEARPARGHENTKV